MKKHAIMLFTLCWLLTACASAQETLPATQTAATSAAVTETVTEAAPVSPLPVTVDTAHLDNCTVAVSLSKGDAYVDDTGVMQMKVTVYTYDLYDMADIARLQVGDTILIRRQDIPVTDLEWTAYGTLMINGGLDEGGYELLTDEATVFYETGYSDVKAWQAVGEATIRVSPDFVYTDSSDPDHDPVICFPGDFLTEAAGIDYSFTPQNTTIVIQNGLVTAMHRVYTP